MKKNSFLWAALSMTAALVMTACSSDDNNMTEAPVAPSTSKTIPYTVTVGSGDATTRATVNDDPSNRELYFASGDKLYITGENIQGVLDLQAGDDGKASGATFSGDLTYSGEGSPAANLELTATLVSAQQTDGEEVTINTTTGAVTVNYPTTAYCADVATAVQEYSRLTGTCEYADKAFTLTQQTAFLNFEITFEDGTATNTPLTAVVNNNSSNICSASVTTVTDNGVKAKFVLPVAAGTTLSSANVKMGDKEAISFGASQTLAGKVYNVKKTQGPTATPLDNTTTAWTDGNTFAVPAGGLTYGNAITVSGDVTLTLTDGTTLTLNKGISLASGATLTVEGNGTMVVNGTSNSTASTVAGSTGTLILTSGTLTATGGNGGNIGDENAAQHGGSGGDAINGSVIVSGGTLTARGGNGGSVGYECFDCSGGNGGDAISGTLTINGGSTSVNDGSNGSIGAEGDGNTAGRGGKAVAGTVTDNRN